MKYRSYLAFFVALLISFNALSKENPGSGKHEKRSLNKKLMAGCEPASEQVDLDINNVRARIMNGGDMWWDLVGSARYEIPKVEEEGVPRKNSLFAGALWIGGFDQGGNLREAAMTYRQQQSYDFFPGPLDTTSASITQDQCVKWDRIWKVSKKEIDEFKEQGAAGITKDIQEWPTSGDITRGQSQNLAPFHDADSNGIYNPFAGDYPEIIGDQAVWFVYNDKGNIHTETKAPAIGLEVQTMAFAYATNDEINNMTFYQQKIINRSKDKLDSVFFGQWVDADLGYAYDDYVGCDTTRDLGFCYNGDDFDETVNGYGSNPPSVGVDFFQGPKDENGNEIGMEYFVYYDNDFTQYGNPEEARDYYNYLTGSWKNNDCITNDGKNGRTGSNCTHYMFPGNPSTNEGWTEVSAGNKPFDRRFIQSAGPFTLLPGAVNYVTVGVVWAKATTGGNTGSLDLLKLADDKAQQLYNNNFELIDGPDAPDVQVQELDKQIILAFLGTKDIENYKESIVSENQNDTIKYIFQGYRIYQLVDASVSLQELDNLDRAREIAQVDVKDEVDILVNTIFDPNVNAENKELKVRGANEGIRHTFSIKSDAFASGSDKLINYKPYYFTVVAYASADPKDPTSQRANIQYLEGRNNVGVYTAYPHPSKSEKGGAVIRANYGDRPSVTRTEGTGNGGLFVDLTDETLAEILDKNMAENPAYKYGKSPVNVFIYDPLSVPNADFKLELIDSTIPNNARNYKALSNNAEWLLTNLDTKKQYKADTTIGANNEQVFPEFGLSVMINQPLGPKSDSVTENGGFIGASMTFKDKDKRWLTGVPDAEIPGSYVSRGIPYPPDWIRSGKFVSADNPFLNDAYIVTDNDATYSVDPNQDYEDILGGIIAPYGLVARTTLINGSYYSDGPAFTEDFLTSPFDIGRIENLNSVDLIFTSDKSKWTQCVVVDLTEQPDYSGISNLTKHFPKEHGSWLDVNTNAYDDNGNLLPSAFVDPSVDKGRSWFPGYAVNVETAQRLNIIFGEDSWFKNDNGDDMIWNPTSNVQNPALSGSDFQKYIWGGKHIIYVMNTYGYLKKGAAAGPAELVSGTPYDGGVTYQKAFQYFQESRTISRFDTVKKIYATAMWVMIPVLANGQKLLSVKDGIIPTKTTIKLRVDKPYATFSSGSEENGHKPSYTFSTKSLSTITNNEEMGKTAVDNIKVVPNPYYAYSKYEVSQLDNRVRFTNLPQKVTISIYTMGGQLVRRFEKDETAANHVSFLDWDLKNSANIPIGSGLYIIHINAYDLGEKTMKWFAVMRPLDLDTF